MTNQTTISLADFSPERPAGSPDLPLGILVNEDGSCSAVYGPGDEDALYSSLVECLDAHEISDEELVDWLSDSGAEDAAELVAVLTDPEREARAQAAAEVAQGLRQERGQA